MNDEKRECACPQATHRHGTVRAYLSDKCRCRPCRTAWADYHRKLRARQYLNGGKLTVDGTGTARRLQALAAIGWSAAQLARHLGCAPYLVQAWRMGRHPVNVRTHDRIAALYDLLWDKTSTTGQPRTATLRHARRRGWVPPMAWDDDTIDDPAARPYVDDIRHGTHAGYNTHRNHGQQPCARCVDAEREYQRGRRKKAA